MRETSEDDPDPHEPKRPFHGALGLASFAILGLAFGQIHGATVAQSDLLIPAATIPAVLLVVLLMLVNAGFQAAESALTSLRRARLTELAEAGHPSYQRLSHLYAELPSFYATCQAGIQLARIGMVVGAVLAAPQIASPFSDSGPLAFWITLLAVLAVVACVNLALIELPFRGLARKSPEKWARRFYGFLRGARVVLSPFVGLVKIVGNTLSKKLGLGPLFAPPVFTEDELREVLESAGEASDLIEDEKEMIHSIIEFTDTVAREVMTPRTDIHAAEVTDDLRTIAKIIEESGHTRIPVYEENIDKIVGVVHAKDVLRALLQRPEATVTSIMRPPYFIPETKELHELLSEFRKGRIQLAIVQDEFGGTEGIVTIEDIVEEIVGDIVDEYDVEEPEVMKVDNHTWLVSGRAHLEDVNDEIGSYFESEEFDTIGGFVFGLFGRQPDVGEVISYNGWDLKVASTDGRRVVRVEAKRKKETGIDA
ncbi:MAG: hypothetical protein AKCLJLPJ_01722 [Fimbriimonadales bacterium]|nr:MAG: HlyC/CorC family transporter [Armatimonadota bacterium]MBV6503637.1 hypothetical protein [Fimbriimonadales bacterium]MCE7900941.1 HlyC/CorC family transporter [Armatimonadetes bacterium ATM1]MDL1929644.1 HlyC/CorC family transporter [Fimbriimonadia bacterium ATM]MBC6970802.1 HlyC/CorC family transporter [Armatimonadota bacterium]